MIVFNCYSTLIATFLKISPCMSVLSKTILKAIENVVPWPFLRSFVFLFNVPNTCRSYSKQLIVFRSGFTENIYSKVLELMTLMLSSSNLSR